MFKYHADHVGSLLRPQELLDAHRNPNLSSQQRNEIENKHILRVLERQKELGFEVFTDGIGVHLQSRSNKPQQSTFLCGDGQFAGQLAWSLWRRRTVGTTA